VGGRRVVLVGSRLYAFRRSAGDMSLSPAQSARAAEGLVVVMVIFGSFKVGVSLEVCGIEGWFAGLVMVITVLRGLLLHPLERLIPLCVGQGDVVFGIISLVLSFSPLVVVELLVVGVLTDGDLRFKELVKVEEGVFPSVFWSCFLKAQ